MTSYRFLRPCEVLPIEAVKRKCFDFVAKQGWSQDRGNNFSASSGTATTKPASSMRRPVFVAGTRLLAYFLPARAAVAVETPAELGSSALSRAVPFGLPRPVQASQPTAA